MDRLYPQHIVRTKFGEVFDPQVLSYGTGLYADPNNKWRGGQAVDFSYVRKVDLTGRTLSAGGDVHFEYIYVFPPNAGHPVETSGALTNGPILLNSFILAITDPITVTGAAADAGTLDLFLEIGLGVAGTLVTTICSMRLAAAVLPVSRPWTISAGDATFGSTAGDKRVAVNESWALATVWYDWGVLYDLLTKEVFVSAPMGGGGIDRLVLNITGGGSSGPVYTVASGKATIWMNGKVLPSY